MGVRNYLVEGVTGTGKTTVAEELARRGHHVVHGDRELAYQGDPATGRPLTAEERASVGGHEHHLWDVDRVRALAADRSHEVTFFCGGSRNFLRFLDVVDGVLVLTVDRDTLLDRLDQRPPGEWGSAPEERALVLRLHETQEDVPDGAVIDATRPLEEVVDAILARVGIGRAEGRPTAPRRGP